MPVKLIRIEKKGPALKRTQFGCLSDVHTLNVTRGCEFRCSYCYARGYSHSPAEGLVLLYSNLPGKIRSELDSPRRRTPVQHVAFNTASDSFQRHPDILKVTYDSMKQILDHGIRMSFLTKGWIPDRFIELFSSFPALVTAGIGLVSISPHYRQIFEPGAATAQERLANIERLRSAGIKPHVRIDPIIPFYTDDERGIRALFHELAKRGVEQVVLSYLHLRPAILKQLKRELPSTTYRLLAGCYKTQDVIEVGTSTKTKLCPLILRQKGYDRFKRLAKDYGITCLICACKNPDMAGQRCLRPSPADNKIPGGPEQLSLFPC
ncbi:MAG: hypothetical protein DRH12_05985 [Deltaproteobacteria bacterium]|nr:MAG: hypothetical protein DRH12_05985 [Deltaproteobacteria bacterium]